MKKFTLAVILIIACIIITGCSNSSSTQNVQESYGMGMIVMPDGSIIKGECEHFIRISGNWVVIKIDGITYSTTDWRVTRWK